jgi:Lipocalin-like domain
VTRGESETPFGASPKDVLIYTFDGRMSAIITHGGRKPLSGDRVSTPVEEKAEAFATSFAYAGRYALSGDKVTHHVEVSTVKN